VSSPHLPHHILASSKFSDNDLALLAAGSCSPLYNSNAFPFVAPTVRLAATRDKTVGRLPIRRSARYTL
jgi:hypothetical protein